MKNTIIILFITTFFACKAQVPTVSLHRPSIGSSENGYYYKDFNNYLNVFEGTWLYTNGNTSFTIVLQKKLMGHLSLPTFNISYYTDAIIGEYKYIENGIEKINTLQNINTNFSSPDNYNIRMNNISIYSDEIGCENCQPGNIYLKGSYSEPNCDSWMNPLLSMRYFVENGVEKIDLHFNPGERIGSDMYGNPPPCDEYALPFGEYILIKQD
jgi:hypothetical protein